jgi:ATP-dependent DNA helicase RecG
MYYLETPISRLDRVGLTTARKLKILGLETVEDLLWHLPFRYDDYSQQASIGQLFAGQTVNVVGNVELIQSKRSPRRRLNITEALINDGTGQVRAVWFNQPYIIKNLKEGDLVSLAGKVSEDYLGLHMSGPIYEKLYQGRGINTQGIVPVYHLTSGLTEKQLRYLLKQVISLSAEIVDWLPQEIASRQSLIGLGEALRLIHFPGGQADIEKAKKRLAFDELFLIQLQARLIKEEMDDNQAPVMAFAEEAIKRLVSSLPFDLTVSQRRSAWEIIKDLGQSKPMSRLLEGDVGSGKTLVALISLFNAAQAGHQGCLMVPTEILASQHYDNACRLLEPLGVRVGLWTGSTKGSIKEAKKTGKQNINDYQVIIGTQALIQPQVKFEKLGLVIIDEQHRFGVNQRKMLLANSGLEPGYVPHLLSMTATPIPRSLALALYGDLDISLLKEKPAERLPIKTKVVGESERAKAYGFIKTEVAAGRQVFVICPLIDQADQGGVKSVKEEYEKLDKEIFPDLPIGLLHGKLKSREKEAVMKDFLEQKTKVLVSTSVIEVGVDVPNATIMLIEGAESFGLAQLHQFRGRVGRGEHQSYCFLFSSPGANADQRRLKALEAYDDGFALSKIDLKFRGPGEVYGTLQKGFFKLKIASLFDLPLMKAAKQEAEDLIDGLKGAETSLIERYPLIHSELGDWERRIHLE